MNNQNKIDINQKICWVIVEKNLTGTQNQCVAVAEKLAEESSNIKTEIKNITLRQPWKLLSPYITDSKLMVKGEKISPPYPDIVIAAGRKSIGIARYIKKKHPNTLVCFIQNPKITNHNFDLIAAPLHDKVKANCVINTYGAANKISPKLLNEHKEKFAINISSPKIAILIGGNSKTHKMTKKITTKICNHIWELSKNHGIMVTASRRTGKENMNILKERISNIKNCYFWNGEGANPYFSFLAQADYIIVTNDSVSMISDAVSTGKPVYFIEMEGNSPKFEHFIENIKKRCGIRKFEGILEKWHYEPLKDAQKIADYIKKLLEERA